MAAAVIAALCVSESVRAGEAPKWGAHLDLEGKLGTERHLGEVDLFLPVAQDDRTLLFTNIRTRMDDGGSREGNFGLGVRTMLDSGWNLGGYGYFDRRRSELDNYFNQVTLGAEALSRDWDVRANAYLPVGRTSHQEDSLSTAEVSGASVIFKGGEERSLAGFDAEIGWRLPVFDPDGAINLRAYAGGYRFADEGVPTVAGPRGRVELVFDEVPHLWDGSRLSLGAEWQRDEPRGPQGFLTARLRIPLQAESNVSRLTPMERRMTDPIVRDIDIVAQAGAFGAAETATAANGGAITVLNSASTTDLVAAVTAAGANSTVILASNFNISIANAGQVVQLQSGQTVMGSGSLKVVSPSGRTAYLSQSGGGITASLNNFASAAVLMGANSTLTGTSVTVSDAAGVIAVYGVQVDGVAGTTISNNVISTTASTSNAIGIRLINTATNATITGNTVTATRTGGGGGSAIGLQMINNSTATVAANSFNATGGATNYGVYRSNSTALTGSTGNVLVAGTCDTSTGTNTGAISFTNGTSCP